MEKLLKIADMRKLHSQMAKGEISYSRMVEIINEKAFKQTCYAVEKALNNFKEKQAEFLIELHNDKKNKNTLSKKTMKLISKHA